MELTIVGSGTGYPYPRRRAPGHHLRIGSERILLDCGPGTVRALAEAGIDFMMIDRIVLTHFHLDHISDIGTFLFASKYHESPRTRDLHIWGPPGTGEICRGFSSLYGKQIESAEFELLIGEEEMLECDGWRVERAPSFHVPESRAYRFREDGGGSIVFTGDTRYDPALARFAAGCDILVTECSLPYSVPGHMTPGDAGRLAMDAGAGRLVLVHLYPPCDDEDIVPLVRKYFDGPVTVGEDGSIVSSGSGEPESWRG